MRYLFALLVALLTNHVFAAEFPKFEMQEIETGLKIGYAVIVVDIDGDKKPDLVVVDQHKVVWYKNPGTRNGDWKKYTILDGKTRPDNVCIAAIDIDGDGLPELVLGAAWKPFDTANAAQLVWLKRGTDVTKEWAMHELRCEEPTVHRVRVLDIDGSGKPAIVHVPLMGRDATQKGNWLDGRPVRVIALKVPAKDPEKKENWKPIVLSDELHVAHNFTHLPIAPTTGTGKGAVLLAASYEGVSEILLNDQHKWITRQIGAGNRGSSEIKMGWPIKEQRVIATIEPWHGNQVVAYTPPVSTKEPTGKELWQRHVIDEQLRWGHALWFADLAGDGVETLIVGVRDDPNPKAGDTFKERRGVRLYKCTDTRGTKWDRMILDDGGVAVEDLTAADLNGDGKIDIIAVGRQTGNVKIYWNLGK